MTRPQCLRKQPTETTKPMPRKKAMVESGEKIWLSTKEVAKYLGMSTGYVHDLRKEGLLPHSMIKNTAFYLKEDVDHLLEVNKVY